MTAPEPAECPRCLGAGYLRMDVPINDPNFGQLITCDCKQEEKVRRRKQQLLQLSNLQAYEQLTFQNFDPDVPGTRAVYLDCLTFGRNPQGWRFLLGGPGRGKTHLAAAIAHEAVARDLDVMFMVVPDLLDHLRSTFGPSSEIEYDQRFETIRNVFLLILDDLGAESATPWAKEKLFQIINHRYNHRLATVITSNYDFEKLDPRLQSRLLDATLCNSHIIEAGDYRRLSVQKRFGNRPYRP